MLISVFPLSMYAAFQDARLISQIYFAVGIVSLISGLCVPWLIGLIPRRWVYSGGASLFVAGSLLAINGTPQTVVLGLTLNTIATVTTFVCFNAYVLDFIAKSDLGRCETSRMVYSALGWTVGPVLGVTLMKLWHPAPFLIAAASALSMLTLFWIMRMGNGKLIARSRRRTPNPVAYLPRFFAQPRLIAGWLFAVIRSCGWWVYVVYVPIFAIENGLGERLGGIVLSVSNAALFLTPLMLRLMMRTSIRFAVRTGFLLSALLFIAATALSGIPWLTVAALMTGSLFLVLLDMSAGLPFLLAVKPSERTEMSAVYSSFRDVSGIATPGAAWLVLLVAPVSGIFAAAGAALLAAWMIAGSVHPRLGRGRVAIETAKRPPATHSPEPMAAE